MQPQKESAMPVTAKSLVEAANAAVPKISGKEAQEMVANGAVLVDIRDSAELAQTGKAAGALHLPRGSLEFKADPASPAADKNLSLDKTIILYCASGGRAALAGKLLKDMGYEKVHNLGGFKDWVEAGGKVEK
jgi:rhodanese-related sulfurtransferase